MPLRDLGALGLKLDDVNLGDLAVPVWTDAEREAIKAALRWACPKPASCRTCQRERSREYAQEVRIYGAKYKR